MTSEEIKEALLKKYPVRANGTKYKCVTAVIYRVRDDRITVSGELLDRRGSSVTVVPLEKIEREGE